MNKNNNHVWLPPPLSKFLPKGTHVSDENLHPTLSDQWHTQDFSMGEGLKK